MIVENELTIPGRGLVFVVPLAQFKELPDRIEGKELEPFIAVGHKFNYKNTQYEITGIEAHRVLMDPPFIPKSASVGILVREVKKTSEEWYQEIKTFIQVMDPDGWDRSNFDFSWHQEKITKPEFSSRVARSTCNMLQMPKFHAWAKGESSAQ